MSRLIPDKLDVHVMARTLSAPDLEPWRDYLIHTHETCRELAADSQAIFELQLIMLAVALNIEEGLQAGEQRHRAAKALLAKLGRQGIRDRRIEEAKEFAEAAFINSKAGRYLRNQLRVIADGIAWRSIGYNRPVIEVVSHRPSTGTLEPGRGLDAEIELAGSLAAQGKVPVLCDLTNCFRLGDVLAVDTASHELEIHEVKSGRKVGRRFERQVRDIHQVMRLTKEGRIEVAGDTWEIGAIERRPAHALDRLSRTITEAKAKGVAVGRVSKVLAVRVDDMTKVAELGGEAQSREFSSRLLRAARKRGGNYVKAMSTWPRAMGFFPTCAPFSVYPFPSEVCVDLSMGRLHATFALNIDLVQRRFEEAGWEVNPVDRKDPGRANFLWTLDRGPVRAMFPGAWLARMAYECSSVDNFVQLIDTAPIVTEVRTSLPRFSREHEVWN